MITDHKGSTVWDILGQLRALQEKQLQNCLLEDNKGFFFLFFCFYTACLKAFD